jgi:signal transduction histidine kinase
VPADVIPQGRHEKMMLELAALDKRDTDEALRRILRFDAESLGIERVNWWSLETTPRAIRCELSYQLSSSAYTGGDTLYERDYPRYFRALLEEQVIAAEDAPVDPRTAEFATTYLQRHRIGAMLDVPVWVGGRLAGVLCHEFVGSTHPWTPAEKELATSMGQLVATTLEVRERQRVEEALRIVSEQRSHLAEREQSARDQVQARDEFLTVASHELNTALTSLQLTLDALRARHLLPEGAGKSFGTLDRQAKRVTQLVSNLLDLSRVQTGRMELAREQFDLAELAREVCERHSEGGMLIDLRTTGAVWGSWDRSRLDQVLTNLLSNATKFGGGRRIEVDVERVRDRARVRVRDRGIGIAPERLPRIFERFERAVSSAYSGLGLGLYIVRAIVEAHEGTVSAESVLGEGTTFTVDLPLGAPA